MIQHLFVKLYNILSEASGWVGLSLSFAFAKICEFAHGKESLAYAVVFCVLLDLLWALWRVFKDKGFALSSLMKDSVAKIAIYGTAMLFGLFFDREGDFMTSIIASVIMLVEGVSIIGSFIIIFPNFPFVKLIKKFFIGEIANKLNCEPDEVEATLGTRYTKKPRRKKA